MFTPGFCIKKNFVGENKVVFVEVLFFSTTVKGLSLLCENLVVYIRFQIPRYHVLDVVFYIANVFDIFYIFVFELGEGHVPFLLDKIMTPFHDVFSSL